VLVLDSDATTAVQGASVLSVSGDVSLSAETTLDLNSTADGSAGNAGGTLAVTEVNAGTHAFVTGSSIIQANGNAPDSVSVGATLDSTVATTATSTAGGAADGGGDGGAHRG